MTSQLDGQAARIEEIRSAHARLRADAAGLDDAAAHEPTGLPGWTRGHVLARLGELARAFARQARHAPLGRTVEVYDDGRAGRNAAIEKGAGRPAAQLPEPANVAHGPLPELGPWP